MRATLRPGACLAALCLAVAWPRAALATDQIICKSASFTVSLAVGSNGYVSNIALQHKDAHTPPGVEEISDLLAQHRHADTARRSLDVIASSAAGRVTLSMRRGRGRIRVGNVTERLVCDWTV